jgi:hypothetical protein
MAAFGTNTLISSSPPVARPVASWLKAVKMRRPIGMPASRAASGLEPIAYSSRPDRKLRRQYAPAAMTTATTMARSGMPPTVALEMVRKDG